MPVSNVIIYISIFFWLLPPVRQYKGNFFLYFLILALSDPVNLFCVKIIGTPPHMILTIAAFLLYYSINPFEEKFKKYWSFHLLLILLFLIALFSLNNLLYLILSLNLLILVKFIQRAIITLHEKSTVNIFLLALIFYELSVVINLLDFLSGGDQGVIFYYTTLSFQILLAIFFTVFREDSSVLKIVLRTVP